MEYLTLYPIGDVHWGASECMESEFKTYLKRIESDDHAAVVILGDILNNGIKSSVTNVYEEKYTPKEQKRQMIELLYPIANKIIGGVRGNHCYRSAKESDIDLMEDIFYDLGIQHAYAQDMGVLKISLGEKRNGKQATYMFAFAHGAGGGSLLGGGVNKADGFQMAIEGVDGILSGHTHKPAKVPSGRLVFDPHNNKVTRTKTLIFICTSWLNASTYAERGLMKPVAFAPDTIWLNGKKKEWR